MACPSTADRYMHFGSRPIGWFPTFSWDENVKSCMSCCHSHQIIKHQKNLCQIHLHKFKHVTHTPLLVSYEYEYEWRIQTLSWKDSEVTPSTHCRKFAEVSGCKSWLYSVCSDPHQKLMCQPPCWRISSASSSNLSPQAGKKKKRIVAGWKKKHPKYSSCCDIKYFPQFIQISRADNCVFLQFQMAMSQNQDLKNPLILLNL